jgi:hypothetical protein
MTVQTECYTQTLPSDEPGIVWGKRNLAMQCANPQCSKELLYLREGRLDLLELESHADDPSRPDEGSFAMRPLPGRFFWLCGECAQTYTVKRWTISGLVAVLRNQKTTGSNRDLAARPHDRKHASASAVPDGRAYASDGAPAPSPRWARAGEKLVSLIASMVVPLVRPARLVLFH